MFRPNLPWPNRRLPCASEGAIVFICGMWKVVVGGCSVFAIAGGCKGCCDEAFASYRKTVACLWSTCRKTPVRWAETDLLDSSRKPGEKESAVAVPSRWGSTSPPWWPGGWRRPQRSQSAWSAPRWGHSCHWRRPCPHWEGQSLGLALTHLDGDRKRKRAVMGSMFQSQEASADW